MTVSAIILAAGAGTRMRSDRPKPLHRICGRPMVLHVIHALERLEPERTAVVVGHGAEQVTKRVQEEAPAWANVAFVEQVRQIADHFGILARKLERPAIGGFGLVGRAHRAAEVAEVAQRQREVRLRPAILQGLLSSPKSFRTVSPQRCTPRPRQKAVFATRSKAGNSKGL